MAKVSNKTHTQKQLDHYSNTHNPNSTTWKQNADNRAKQLNPNNDAYWKSRGMEKPSDNKQGSKSKK